MKIRKIFAGFAAAAMAASMMSVAASANTKIDAPSDWQNFLTQGDSSFGGIDWNAAGLTKAVVTVKNTDYNYGWTNINLAGNSVAGWNQQLAGGPNQATDEKVEKGEAVLVGDGGEGEVTLSLVPGTGDDNWWQIKAGYTTADAWEIVDVEFYAGEDLIGTWADGEYKPAIETISTVDITVVAPQPGDTVTVDDDNVQTPLPEFTVPSDGGYKIRATNYIGETSLFEGTFESDVDYGVAFLVVPDEGYQFAEDDDLTVKINGSTENVKVNFSDAGLTVIGAVKSEHVDVEYTAEKADGYTYTLESEELPSIVINRSIGNDKTFGLFTGLYNGDKELVKDTDFTAESGSLKLALTKAYLNSLAAGDYTFIAAFEDGEAEFKLTVAEAPKTEEPTTEEPKTEDPKTEEPKTEEPKTEEPKDETPKTGAAAGALAAIALVGGVAVAASRKRK